MIEKVFNEIIKNFDNREQDIITRRYGLKGKEETLTSIGNTYNISRERIRQIQKKIVNQLKPLINNHPQVEKIIRNIKKNHFNYLGVRKEKKLFTLLKTKEGFNDYQFRIFRFFSIFHKDIIYHQGDEIFDNFFCQNEQIYLKIQQWLKETYTKFIKENHYLLEEELIKFISDELKKKINHIPEREEVIEILTIIKHIAKNPFNFWGLKNHHYISPKRLKDKIILILKHENQPLHFTHIHKILMEFKSINHDSISDHWRKKYNLYSIKNELLRHPDFILVGRGTYGLKEWNMEAGKVKELIEKFIKEKGKLTRDELWKIISTHRNIKKQTFYVYIIELKQKGLKEKNGYLTYYD